MKRDRLKLFKKNVKFLKEKFTDAYQYLFRPHYDHGLQIDIVLDEGQENLLINQKHVYDQDYEKRLHDLLEKTHQRLSKRYKSVNILFDSGYWENSLHYQSLKKIVEIKKRFETRDPIEDTFIPLMVNYGVGFGWHIPILLEKFQIKNLILADLDVELIKPALYSFDWEQVFKNTNIEFAVGRESEHLAKEIYSKIKKINELYIHYFEEFVLYDNVVLRSAKEKLEEKKYLYSDNWGFFDDEYLSLKHTLENVPKKPPFYIKKNEIDSVPVFIVGSGPSLDNDIEMIKKLKKDAIIFSCGTALRPLVQNDIWPDFQFILERTEPPYEAMLQTLPKKSLDELNIVAVNLAYPKIFDFGNSFMVTRGSDIGSTLFPKQEFLPNAAPTVTNLAFSFGLSSGFKEIYLFGIDLGFKDPCAHHSKDSVYYKKNNFKMEKMQYEYEIEGNFGGIIYTNSVLYQTKNSFEANIRLYPSAQVFNCSDGGKIEGARPKRSKELIAEFAQKNIDKSTALDKVMRNFDRGYFNKNILDRIFQNFHSRLREFQVWVRYFRMKFDKNFEEIDEIFTLVDNLYQIIEKQKQKRPGSYLFASALYHQLSCTILAMYCIPPESRMVFFRHSFHEIVGYLKKAEKKLCDLTK